MPTTPVMGISEVTAPWHEVELALRARGFQPAGTRGALIFCCDFWGDSGHLNIMGAGSVQGNYIQI